MALIVKDTNGNELIPGKKYIVRTNDIWEEEIYGQPPAPVELVFARYDRIHHPFFHSDGHIVGKPPSTYVYERVLSEARRSSSHAQIRRPASKARRYSSKIVPEASIAANRAKTARALARRASSKGGYRKNKTRRR